MVFINKKFLRFLIVGSINTIIGATIIFFLYNIIGVSYWISSVCYYVIGGILSFFLNKFYTFRNNKKSFKQVFLFILIIVICYFIAYFAAKKIVYLIFFDYSEKIKGNVALFCGIILYTLLNYLGQRFIIFREV